MPVAVQACLIAVQRQALILRRNLGFVAYRTVTNSGSLRCQPTASPPHAYCPFTFPCHAPCPPLLVQLGLHSLIAVRL